MKLEEVKEIIFELNEIDKIKKLDSYGKHMRKIQMRRLYREMEQREREKKRTGEANFVV